VPHEHQQGHHQHAEDAEARDLDRVEVPLAAALLVLGPASVEIQRSALAFRGGHSLIMIRPCTD